MGNLKPPFELHIRYNNHDVYLEYADLIHKYATVKEVNQYLKDFPLEYFKNNEEDMRSLLAGLKEIIYPMQNRELMKQLRNKYKTTKVAKTFFSKINIEEWKQMSDADRNAKLLKVVKEAEIEVLKRVVEEEKKHAER